MNTITGHPFENGDSLNIRFYSAVAATYAVDVRYYISGRNTEVIMRKTYTTGTTGALEEYFEPMTKCILISIQVSVLSGTVSRGHCWVELRHQRGLTSGGFPLSVLLNGYPSSASAISFPQNVLIEPGSGQGVTGAARFTPPTYSYGGGLRGIVPVSKQFVQIIGIRLDCTIDLSVATTRYIYADVVPNGNGNATITLPNSTPFNNTTYPGGAISVLYGTYATREIAQRLSLPPIELIPAPMGILEFAGATNNEIFAQIYPNVGTDEIYAMEIIYRSWVAP